MESDQEHAASRLASMDGGWGIDVARHDDVRREESLREDRDRRQTPLAFGAGGLFATSRLLQCRSDRCRGPPPSHSVSSSRPAVLVSSTTSQPATGPGL